MKHAHYDSNGNILGFYDPSIHAAIPTPTVTLTDQQWRDCVDNLGASKIDTKSKTIVAVPRDQAELRESNNALIDTETYQLIKDWRLNQGKCEEYYINRGVERGKTDTEYQAYKTQKDSIIKNQSRRKRS